MFLEEKYDFSSLVLISLYPNVFAYIGHTVNISNVYHF